LERALAKSADERFPSAGDLGRAALAAAVGEPVTEEERTVARGAAAPPATEVRPASTLWLPPTGSGRRRRASARAALAGVVRRRRRASLRAALAAGVLAAAAVAVIGVVRARPELAAS